MELKFAIRAALLGGMLAACGNAGGSGGGSAGASTADAGARSSSAGRANGGSGTGAGLAGATAAGAAGESGGNGGSLAGGGSGAGGGNAAGTGGGGGSAPAAGTTPLKGLAFNLSGSSCDDLPTLGVSWFYAWAANNPCATVRAEFVPQIWGSYKDRPGVATPATAVAKGAKFLLGFNEPDGADQANMTVAEAVALWPDFQVPGVLVGSPAVAGQGSWLPEFMMQVSAKSLRVDFIALHWYGWDAGSCNDTTALEGKIKWAEQWQRPIWITEWSCRLQSADVDKKFLADAQVMLAKHPLVERYAWFLSRSSGEFVNAALLDASGKPTAIGSEYASAPAFH
ncbi:MAG: glycosyl hydrolase [Pseudomonadota bacterium]